MQYCAVHHMTLQETLLNLLLRNYLHYNLYDQAEKLRSKAPRFEAHSNQQVTAYFLLIFLMKILHLPKEYSSRYFLCCTVWVESKAYFWYFCFPLVLFCPYTIWYFNFTWSNLNIKFSYKAIIYSFL